MTKTAIVTGGSRGIGARVTQELAAAGWHVVVLSRSVPEKLERDVEYRPLDLSSLGAIRAFAKSWSDPVHALVNNAGMMLQPGEKMERTVEGLEPTMATNYFGPALLSGLFLPKLRASGGGRIVNVGSRSIFGFPGMNGPARWDWENLNGEKKFEEVEAYKRSKLALTWFTMGLAHRLPDRAVTANVVCPGFVPETVVPKTKGFQQFLFKRVLPHVPGAVALDVAGKNVAWAVTDPLPGDVSGHLFGERKNVELKDPARYDHATIERLFELTTKVTGHTY